MCMACQQADQERIWALIDVISQGIMPAGHTEADLREMGLPVPGELYRDEQPDGTILIRQHSPAEIAKNAAKANAKNKFICD